MSKQIGHQPLVSIIMPAYNAEKYIAEAIESIIAQTYTNWELLIADDGSTDNTKDIIEAYCGKDKRIKAYHNQTNQKLLKTRNKLIAKAKGDYITFQDADDYSHTERLEKQVKCFLNDHNLGLVGTFVQIVDDKGSKIRVHKKPVEHDDILKRLQVYNAFGGATMMIGKNALNAVGGKFRPFFDGLSCQEYDLAFLISEKYKTKNIPEPLYYYRMNRKSASKIISVDRQIVYDLVKHFGWQRQNEGSDYIMREDIEGVEKIKKSLYAPYKKDSSLIFRQYASNFMYSKLRSNAIIASLKAIRKRPGLIVNYRTLFYCIRKSIL